MTGKIVFTIFTFFLNFSIQGQIFDRAIDPTSMTIEGQEREGYRTSFSLSAKQVEKEWWRYCREFGRLINMKDFYRVVIPSDVNSGNVSLTLLSITSPTKQGSKFFLALDQKDVPANKIISYNRQVRSILLRFKQKVYIDELNKILTALEVKASRTSKKVRKREGAAKSRALNELAKLEAEMEDITRRIEQVYQAY